MHKDVEVASYTCKSNGSFNHLVEVKREDLLPDRTREYDIATRRWLLTRRQSSRINEFSDVRRFYGQSFFASRNLRSMTDCYWVRDDDENPYETWDEVNPYSTWDSTSDSLFMMMYKPADFDGVDDSSPNLTISGTVPLMWYEFDELGLINERAQSDINIYREAKARNFDCVEKREYKIVAGRVFSFRKVAVSENIERIPFDLYYNMMEDTNLSKSENIARCCSKLGIENWKTFISEMIELDKICGKVDRDLCDIGVLRDANTLECFAFDKL